MNVNILFMHGPRERIRAGAGVFEIDPLDIISFDDNLVFHNCHQSGKFGQFYNQIPEKLIEQYELRIKCLEEEIRFLRNELMSDNK